MRITRVAFAFFSVGFLAGSFERAAGLGDVGGHVGGHLEDGPMPLGFGAPPSGVPAGLAPPVPVAADPASPGKAATAALGADAPGGGKLLPERALVRIEGPDIDPELESGRSPQAAKAALLDAAFHRFLSREPKRPMSLLGRHALSPVPQPTFISLPGGDDTSLPGASAPHQAETPRTEHSVPAAVAEVPGPELEPRPVFGAEFILPFERGRVSSLFNDGRRHPAIDLAGRLGTPVHATTRRQKVAYTGWRGGYGRLVITRDPQGRRHYYAHLQRILVRVGAVLDQGERLGLLGSTGRSTGPHVHYEVRTRHGHRLNPARLLFPGMRVRRGHAWSGAHSVARLAASNSRSRRQ